MPKKDDGGYAEFERKMILFEDGPTTTNFQQLIDGGIDLPEPDLIDDARIGAQLWELIKALAKLRVYLDESNHLSDRELYAKLWHETLRQEVPAIDELGFSSHVGLLSGGGEPETRLYLKYFADDRWREDWLKEFPDYELPAHEDPPYDRDRHLPKPPRGRGFRA